jgi:hypothetical protein
MKRLERSANELEALRQAVAASPIRIPALPAPAAAIPDWETRRRSDDVDAVVLAWIASHVRAGGHRRTH